MQILKASEDYLETMLMLRNSLGYVRSVDVAEHLGVTKPSVTYATKRLRENGYIEMDKDGLITLTDSGMEIAAKMLQRHHTLTNFLVELGVDPVTAEEDACKMEHDISDQTFRAICDLADKDLNALGDAHVHDPALNGTLTVELDNLDCLADLDFSQCFHACFLPLY